MRSRLTGLRRARLLLGLSQQAAATRLCVGYRTWQRWERGVSRPQPVFRAALVALLAEAAAVRRDEMRARSRAAANR